MVDAVYTTLAWTNISIDTHNTYDSGIDKWVAPVSGMYQINAGVGVAAGAGWDAGELVYLTVDINNVAKMFKRKEIAVTTATSMFMDPPPISNAIYLNKGDQVEVTVYQSNDSDRSTLSGASTYFSVVKQ